MVEIKTVGVIGAGQMGIGIAQVSAQAGYDVILSDIDLPRAEKGKAGIAKLLSRAVEKGKMEQADADAILARITPVGEIAPLAAAQLVIEAATEREEIKRAIFSNVGALLAPDAILATNTSSIPITRLFDRDLTFQRLLPGLRGVPPTATMRRGLRGGPGDLAHPQHGR